MNRILLGLLGVLLATNYLRADDHSRLGDLDIPGLLADTNNVQYQALKHVMEGDDAAMDEVNAWIAENNAFAAKGAGESRDELNKRIMARLQTVREAYQDFLKHYSTNAAAYLAYGSFLDDIGDEEGARDQYEKSRLLDPKNPAVWNDLANYYGENSPVTNAFAYYARAIELDPNQPVYYENFATTVYLFRTDAKQFYGINEQQVFDKALALYQKAIQLDPDDLVLMTDYAESYYGIRPLRPHDALEAWTNALATTHTDLEREGVYIHLARVKILAGRFTEAQGQLDEITNAAYAALKTRLERSLAQHEQQATNSSATNSAP